MPSQARMRFEENKQDIHHLWSIHGEIAKPGRRSRRRVNILNRAAVIFAAACWESYIEDVAMEAFDRLLESASSPDVFPPRVRVAASKELRESKDERRIWDLAGEGWLTILRLHRDAIRDRWMKDFNTPKSVQVSDLFSSLLDISDVTSTWGDESMTADEAALKLDEYMTIRGNIAHRLKHDETVYKSGAKAFVSHIVKLVERTNDAVALHVESLTKQSPWESSR